MKRLVLVACALVLGGCNLFASPGKPCQKHEDCNAMPEGYCSRVEICTRECSTANPCPDDDGFTKFICSPQGVRQVCLERCEGDADCDPGFVCRESACVIAAPFAPPK